MSEAEFMSIFADNLRDIMLEVGMSQNELADKIGINKGSVSRFLNKQIIPSLPTYINICTALGCNLEELVPTYDYVH